MAAAPGAVMAHRRTPPAVLGMILLVASELMFFGGLFAAYFTLRGGTASWPPPDVELDMGLTVVATVLLTASSVTMSRAIQGLRRQDGDAGKPLAWLLATLALGGAFLAIKVFELAVAPFGPSSHAYGSVFFTMLGAHGVHLAVGMALVAVLLSRARSMSSGGREAVGLYWHFVDVVWLAIFGTVYLIR